MTNTMKGNEMATQALGWEVFIVYHEPSSTWEAVCTSKGQAEELAAEKGEGFKVAPGVMRPAAHSTGE